MLRRKLKRNRSGIDEVDGASAPKETAVTEPEIKEAKVDGDITSNNIPLWKKLYDIEIRMNAQLRGLKFGGPVAAVYNPVEYASELHCAYMRKFLTGQKHVLFVGMNPGPWGMCQTGVPFGYIPAIRDWMKLEGNVQKPEGELAVRPVDGLKCTRAEQSGQRFWGLLESLCGPPENFFENCFVYNLCPLAFFKSSGANVTPAELKGEEKRKLQEICNNRLAEAINLLEPRVIVSIGRYVEDRVKELFKQNAIDHSIGHKCLPHPSPRSVNNTNWGEKARKWLIENDVDRFLKKSQ
ncbi:single-strand selective monofunctional uracil DNA glycosylase [Phlebotomus argentipes]|uniref:single-strand selective monofunctional uracil DNA glycosylase n=1 Tax=Phlebotomus argentipes TaxID=94469 RepID=UPI002892AA25|nr:single-strand selective monofunctional uracil DNA glycosylase [Phlebotomus argentipes]